ncbi:hypothetical protein, partial [Paraburkholderia graminis]|uniref:hypothetical protein n=1 Tax=Paraburkholderia graminis TaxID=60548 RepID=UPI0038BE0D02
IAVVYTAKSAPASELAALRVRAFLYSRVYLFCAKTAVYTASHDLRRADLLRRVSRRSYDPRCAHWRIS